MQTQWLRLSQPTDPNVYRFKLPRSVVWDPDLLELGIECYANVLWSKDEIAVDDVWRGPKIELYFDGSVVASMTERDLSDEDWHHIEAYLGSREATEDALYQAGEDIEDARSQDEDARLEEWKLNRRRP